MKTLIKIFNFRALHTLKQKTVFAFLLICIFTLVNVFVANILLDKSADIATTVNIAGKLRMLSQQTGLQTFAVRQAPNHLYIKSENLEESFHQAYMALLNGGTAFGVTIPPLDSVSREYLYNVHDIWVDYLLSLNRLRANGAHLQGGILSSSNQADVAEVFDLGDKLLNATESLMFQVLKSYKKIQNQVVYSAYALLLFNVLLLLFAYQIFRARILHPIESLSTHASHIANSNYAYRSHIKYADEFGKLSEALNKSAAHIEQLLGDVATERANLKQANDIFAGLAANNVAGIYMLNQDSEFIYVNPQLAKILGYEQTLLGNNFPISKIFDANTLKIVNENIGRRLSNVEVSTHYECTAIKSDGTPIELEIFGSILKQRDRSLIIGMVLDITERKRAELSQQRAALIYNHSSEGMIVTDEDGVVLDVNPAFTNITGYEPHEIIGFRLNKVSSGKHNQQFYENMWRELDETGSWQGDIWNKRKSGDEFIEHLSINTSYDVHGNVNFRIGLFSDVTEKRRREASIWHQANFDNLTKLPNRQMFQDNLQHAMDESNKSGTQFALVFLDLDLFKEVNDTFGHDEGDELLKIVAKRLQGCIRGSDLVARLGGDEFTIILRNFTDTKSIFQICEKIIFSVAQPYTLKSNIVSISASVGVTFYPSDGADANDLLRNADLAMYAAKDKGRNQFCVFSHDMQEQANGRKQLIRQIHTALSDRQFDLYYQPIVSMADKSVVKAEALIRWRHPERGLIMPNEFIGLAEDTGQIVQIGEWVFEQAVKQLVNWRETRHKDFSISINTSPLQFQADGIDPAKWVQLLGKHNLPCSALNLEITERLLLDTESSHESLDRLQSLHNAGFTIALDDFGTGYSSLSYLKRFDINILKIDQSYVRNLGPDSEDLVLCQAIIAMAHALGIEVVAEGVSTAEQHELLLQAGCDYGQGYLYGKPVPVDNCCV